MTGVRVAALTECGAVRTDNQDAVLALGWISQAARPRVVELATDGEPPLLLAVADGLGGHNAGALASRLAAAELATRHPGWDSPEAVHAGLIAAGETLHYTGARAAATAGMRTTVAGVLVTADAVGVFNVGDSRVYRITDGYLEQLTVDHASGRSTVTQALGDPPADPLDPFVLFTPREPGRYLLCTDGIHGAVDERILRKACRLEDSRELVEALRSEAYAAGAPDNLSVLVADLTT
ncbi:protein phosphatase [Actinoplanes lutulentus]|uniref:Serine/threonine protein phosphatase PrpC n=1 Tax=Actinoplanes lutulentus TaxID=1287878 RepID=A0A327ZAY0_9ACTN|nr:PP2C family serine/threonine-protein phosphatase [Actinoplanes lutulentus]MBB2946869.1 protein phosphatase [Actinoplanes lutulentus]RAK35763.1 serine/threonine protein phosphatase PrpC [Actinoplanes lutulentus]